jgi:hypothetical protein
MLTATDNEPRFSDGLSTSDEARHLADELELEVQLATMSERDRWRLAIPRLAALQEEIEDSGYQITDTVQDELAFVRTLLGDLEVVLN